jgi:hypothetical protein
VYLIEGSQCTCYTKDRLNHLKLKWLNPMATSGVQTSFGERLREPPIAQSSVEIGHAGPAPFWIEGRQLSS